jgi:hypothetical protein
MEYTLPIRKQLDPNKRPFSLDLDEPPVARLAL